MKIGPYFMALAASVLSGCLAQLLHIPLPWMIGPMLAMAALKIARVEVRPAARGRELGQSIIGTAVGLFFTPAVLHEISGVLGLMLGAGVAAILIGYISALAVSRLAGVDMTTAFFASVPGGAAEMTLLGERYGSGPEFVAMAQSLRMMLVVLIVPPLLTLSGASGSVPYAMARADVDLAGLLQLFLVCGGAGYLLYRAGAPTPWMLGPLLCSVLLTGSGLSFSAMPGAVSALGQLLIGCALGCRFQREFLIQAPRLVRGILAGVCLTLFLSALLGMTLGALGGIPAPAMILATAPGGFAEMSITAKVLKLGVPLVAAFHVMRLLMLLTMTAPVFRLAIYLRQRRQA